MTFKTKKKKKLGCYCEVSYVFALSSLFLARTSQIILRLFIVTPGTEIKSPWISSEMQLLKSTDKHHCLAMSRGKNNPPHGLTDALNYRMNQLLLEVSLVVVTQYHCIKSKILNDSSLWGDTQQRCTRDTWVRTIFYLTHTVSLHFNYFTLWCPGMRRISMAFEMFQQLKNFNLQIVCFPKRLIQWFSIRKSR